MDSSTALRTFTLFFALIIYLGFVCFYKHLLHFYPCLEGGITPYLFLLMVSSVSCGECLLRV